MTDKMTLVLVKDTGHVIAALTRAADPEASLTPDVLAGEGLLVRYIGDLSDSGFGDTEFLIEPDQLDVVVADFDEDVITNPRGFRVDENKQVTPLDVVNGVGANFSQPTQVEITLDAAVTDEAKVWLQVVGPTPEERQTATAKIDAAASTVTVNLRPLVVGTAYHVLAFVAGLAPHTVVDTP